MKLFAFWPVLILLSVPSMTLLYWEIGTPEYADQGECEARLAALEEKASADNDFRVVAGEFNGGVPPAMSFSRECINKNPIDYAHEIAHGLRPDIRS
jgi:hypothetical protein